MGVSAALAQVPRGPAPRAAEGPRRAVRPLLDALNYDAAERGPLLIVNPPATVPADVGGDTDRVALSTLAAAMQMRQVTVGKAGAIVPLSFTTLTADPGKADPFAGMMALDRLRLFFAVLTPEQWNLLGGSGGIGAADLTRDQRPLWDSLFPQTAQIQKRSYHREEDRNIVLARTESVIDVSNPAQSARLRLNKELAFGFMTPEGKGGLVLGAKNIDTETDGFTDYNAAATQTDPATGKIKAGMWFIPGNETSRDSAFGAHLIVTVPNRLKSGQLDFAAAALDSRITLNNTSGAALPTIGDFLTRIGQATGYDFRCDQRLRDLQVWGRGDAIRSGDALMALAWGVGGAFRKIEPAKAGDKPIWLLVEDVEGIGARVGRVREWAQDADAVRRQAISDADAEVRRADPISHFKYASTDRYNPGDKITRDVEAAMRTNRNEGMPEYRISDLPPALAESFRGTLQALSQSDPAFANMAGDRVRLLEGMSLKLLMPEAPGIPIGLDILPPLSMNGYLKSVTSDPDAASTTSKRPLGFLTPDLNAAGATQRRILIAHPANPAEASALVRSAAARGLTDLWIEVAAGSGDTKANRALLQSAVKASGGTKLAIGASIRLLRTNNGERSPVASAAAVNILGESGRDFVDRSVKRRFPHWQKGSGEPDSAEAAAFARQMSVYDGWFVPRTPGETEALYHRVEDLAAVPGLASVTIRCGTPPGFAGSIRGDDGIAPDGEFDYSPAERRAFLEEKGIDPVDIVTSTGLPRLAWSIGDFPELDTGSLFRMPPRGGESRPAGEAPKLSWWVWRQKENETLLSGLYRTLRSAQPSLPIFMDDRVSGYVHGHVDWFGSWDSATALPENITSAAGTTIRASAHKTSKSVFFHWGWQWTPEEATKLDAPTTFARAATDTAYENAAPDWDGIVLDMTNLSGTDLLRLLQGLPSAP